MTVATRTKIESSARRALLERKRSLMARRQTAETEGHELLAEREPDWEDQAARETAAAMVERVADNERAQLAHVIEALERLDQGSWGRCVNCGGAIDPARLQAVPWTTRCSGCTDHH